MISAVPNGYIRGNRRPKSALADRGDRGSLGSLRSFPWLWLAVFLLLFPRATMGQEPDFNIVAEPPGMSVLDQRGGQGEQCLVCDQRVFGKDVVEVRYQGRIFHVAAGEMFQLFINDPELYFRKLRARSALFDERSVGRSSMNWGWLGFGLYVLLGLVVGAVCGYQAVKKGLSPVPWFFAGLVGNGAVLAVLLNSADQRDARAPAGIPSGLRKVPVTYTPMVCNACGANNHPSARLCSGCGADLEPSVEPETARAT